MNRAGGVARPRQLLLVLSLSIAIFLGILPDRSLAEAEPGAAAQAPTGMPAGKVINPGAQLWRDIRQRDGQVTGTTQVPGMDSGVLINADGERWRRFRMEMLVPVAGVAFAAVLGLIGFYHLVKRGVKIEHGRANQYLFRFAEIDRVLHWSVAIIFIFLALTGLVLLAGRFVLLPWMGPDVFSALASASKEGHNLFGPMFLVGIVLLFIRFVSKNFPGKGDIGWLLRAGGFLGGKHPTAGFFNMGEKIWFWMLMLVGLVISITGLILEFPFFGQGRQLMALSLALHGIGAVLLIAGAFGHIYVGTAGMEGSINSMTSGYVDVNWARQHHDLWAEECEARGDVLSQAEFERSQGKSALGEVPEPVSRGES